MIRSISTHSETECLRIPLKSVLPIRKLLVSHVISYVLGVISAREDLDVVFPWNAPYVIKR